METRNAKLVHAISIHAGLDAILGPGIVLASYQHVHLLETAAGELITLAVPKLGNGPYAVLVQQARWPVGTRFSPLGQAGLWFETGPAIDWSGAQRWSPADSAPTGPPDRAAVEPLEAELRKLPIAEGLLPVLLGHPAEKAAQRALAARAGPLIAALPRPEAAALLVGLGPGSTPSGDDLLAGLLLTLHYASHPAAEGLRQVAQGACTTRLGQALLRWAARGEAREHVLLLLRCLFDGPDSGLSQALQPVLQHGATSGADLCAGILLGLKCLVSRF